MSLHGKRVGFALTGSHCTLERVFPHLERLVVEGADVLPIVSESVASVESRFGTPENWLTRLHEITGKRALRRVSEVEPIGPERLLDVMVVAPCTGNTLAKLANAITDGPVLMACKAHLRNQRPVVLSIATNDGLGMNAKNLGQLLNTRHVYFVPFGQDNPDTKPNSLDSDLSLLVPTVEAALSGRQLQPVLVSRVQV
ncbi:MAG: dipicolinate synthase subunit B [Bacillota bacterium]|nr:MAG: dipicolinate synthase subunit B [Bacillota bacterium]